jgi:hypothetical protein
VSRRPRRTPEEVLLRLEQLAPTLRSPASGRSIARALNRHPGDAGVHLALRDLTAAGVLRRGPLGYQAADAPAPPTPRELDEPQAPMCECDKPNRFRDRTFGRGEPGAIRCMKCGRATTAPSQPTGERLSRSYSPTVLGACACRPGVAGHDQAGAPICTRCGAVYLPPSPLVAA